uniref:Uncharacterized protein n=1 Tax=Eptatretus burgeri TaxID=7764 RepID=A0A8C4N6Y3_EPTBU
MDIVLNFAIHKLRFDIDRIFIYAWSIGGFTATWAAMSYPEIAGLVLDASFDNLVPLALKVMPEGWRSLVVLTVKEHMNLNNCEQLCKYPGPVLLIRRTLDEVISLVPEDPSTNRGNELLMRLMKHRYPNLMVEKSCRVLLGWLAFGKPSDEAKLYSQVVVSEEWCSSTIHDYIEQEGDTYPWALGSDLTDDQKNQMVIFLAKRYMKNVNMSHCTPLPASDFALPKHAGIILSGGSTGH